MGRQTNYCFETITIMIMLKELIEEKSLFVESGEREQKRTLVCVP